MKVTLVSYTKDPFRTIAEAASVCYNSEPSLAIVRGCIKSGHHSVLEHASFTFKVEGISRACYDRQTEVLTKEGWKYFYDVDDNDLIMTINQETGEAEFQPILNKIQYKYTGIIHKYKSQNIDLVITPNHNLYMRRYDVRTPEKYHLISSEKITQKRFYMTKAMKYNKKNDEYIIIPGYSYLKKNGQGEFLTKILSDLRIKREDFYKLLAWYISEGSTYYNKKENSYTISISQLKEGNINHIMEIISNCGFNPYYDGKSICFKNLVMGKYLKELGLPFNKKIPFNIFENFDSNLAKIFIDEYIKGGGTIDKNGCGKIYTISKELCEQLYSLSFIAGYTAIKRVDDRVGQERVLNGNIIHNNYPCYVLNLSMSGKRNHEIVIKKDEHFSEEYFDDYVYCLEVPNHTLFVRRNGIACWCGNCTHQLVRHRLASYSQRSQRYCSEIGTTDYVVPPTIKSGGQELVDDYMDTIKRIQRDYQDLTKAVPAEDARMLLPNACPTTIYVTMNLRALAHFCNERLCHRAQWEIREVAKLMKSSLLTCPDIKKEEVELVEILLVPKCGALGVCPEVRGCGRVATLNEIMRDVFALTDENKELKRQLTILQDPH